MAGRWSNDCVVAEHRDIQACAMGMDCSGNFALLAGYKCLALISLDDPADVVRSISRPYKDNIKNVQWSPIASCKELCALTNNHKVEILRWRLGEGTACVGELLGDHVSMDGHSRFVTDIDWHRLEPNIIASGAGDGWIHMWDIREHRHPAISFSSIAWVNLICWNRVNEHLLASAHAGDLRLWDRRKYSSPIQYISAHPGEVHDLDWSTVREAELVTCGGQDCSVRFFNVWRPEKPKAFLATASPVWRAQHAPFGEGLVTSVSSSNNQKDPSGNNSQLLLWKRCRGRDEGPPESCKIKQPLPSAAAASPARRHSTPAASPVHTFAGHTDIVLDFQWRKNRDEPTNYELVTWSMDQSLRIWRIDPLLQKLCGYEPDVESYSELQECDTTAEISIVNNVVHKEIEELSVSLGRRGVWGKEIRRKESAPLTEGEEDDRGSCFIGSRSLDSGHLCSSFSTLGQPHNNFIWETKAKELGCRRESASEEVAAEAKAEEYTPCTAVEEASTVLEGTPNLKPEVESVTPNENANAAVANSGQPTPSIPLPPPLPHLTPPVLESSTPYGGGFQDSFVPFPQTSGARFSSAGFLVCFARPSASRCPWPSTAEVVGNSNGSAFSSASSTCSSSSSYVGATMPSTPTAPSTSTPRSLSALGGASIGTFLGVVPSLAPNTVSSNSVEHHSGSSREVNMLQKNNARNSHLGHSRSKSSQNMVKSKKNVKEKKGGDSSSSSTKGWALVTIYDASKLLFLHRELGEQYIFDTKDLPGMCQTNAMVAASVGRKDLVQVWTLAGLTASCFSTPRQSNTPASIIPRSLAAAAAAGGWMGITAGLLEDDEEQRIALDEELTDSEGEDIPWSHHPLGRPLIESMIAYYASQHDLQTAAMLCCAFGNQNELQSSVEKKKSYGMGPSINSSKSATISSVNQHPVFKNHFTAKEENQTIHQPGGSPYHTVHPGGGGIGGVGVGSESGASEGWLEGALAPILKQSRSNSWSDSLDDMRAAAAIVEHREAGGRTTHHPRLSSLHHAQHQIWQGGGMLSSRAYAIGGQRERNILTLDSSKRLLYDEYKAEYSEILNRWHLLEARAQVLKFVSTPVEPHRGVEFVSDCQHCSQTVRAAHCLYCKRLSLLCVICHVSVRGCSNFCLVCGHGGHMNHMNDWFAQEGLCPSGCGCRCLQQSAAILD